MGVGEDEIGPFMGIALVYDDSDQADEDTSVMEVRMQLGQSLYGNDTWENFFSNNEISSEGRLLLVKTRTERPTRPPFIFQVIEKRDSLLIYE